MTIVGVSFDPPDRNAKWAEDKGFSFELWSDEERTLALHYGAADRAEQGMAKRITRILDEEGNVVLEYNDVNVGTHPAYVLEDCKVLFPQ